MVNISTETRFRRNPDIPIRTARDLYGLLDEISDIGNQTSSNSSSITTIINNITGILNTILTISGIPQDLSANRTWLWSASKYHIEAGESVLVPAKYQHLHSNELINDGSIVNDGEIIEV